MISTIITFGIAIVFFFYIIHQVGGGKQTVVGEEAKEKSRKKMIKFFLGVPVVALVGFLFAGDDFFTLLAFSIICTLGGAAFLWGALCYGIGSVIYSVATSISGKDGSDKNGQVYFTDENTRNQLALVEYIQKALAQGVSLETIRQNLESVGWKEADINAAIDRLK